MENHTFPKKACKNMGTRSGPPHPTHKRDTKKYTPPAAAPSQSGFATKRMGRKKSIPPLRRTSRGLRVSAFGHMSDGPPGACKSTVKWKRSNKMAKLDYNAVCVPPPSVNPKCKHQSLLGQPGPPGPLGTPPKLAHQTKVYIYK